MNPLLLGLYSLHAYLPLSLLSRRWRRFARSVRGTPNRFLQTTQLPQVSWRACTPIRTPRIWEPSKANGNVRLSELAILAALAQSCPPHTNLFEIGTFDGRTTLNLALNAPLPCPIFTLDLPPDHPTRFAIAPGERHMIDKPAPGARYRARAHTHPQPIARIHQLHGDSATFDYTPYEHSCSLVFVDGSHAYDYARSDSQAAQRLVAPDGIVVWHDYGIWEGVTRALEELEHTQRPGLLNIRGTSLVYWKAPPLRPT